MFGIVRRGFPDGGCVKMSDGEVLPMPRRWSAADKETYESALLVWTHYATGGGVSITNVEETGSHFIRFGDNKDPLGPVSDEELAQFPDAVAAAYRHWRGH